MSSFACGTCRDTFAELSELVDHLQTHKNPNETSADQVEKPKTRWTNEQSVALINAYGDMKLIIDCFQKIHRRVPKKTDMLAWLNEYKKDQIEENKKTREQEERQHKEKMS